MCNCSRVCSTFDFFLVCDFVETRLRFYLEITIVWNLTRLLCSHFPNQTYAHCTYREYFFSLSRLHSCTKWYCNRLIIGYLHCNRNDNFIVTEKIIFFWSHLLIAVLKIRFKKSLWRWKNKSLCSFWHFISINRFRIS